MKATSNECMLGHQPDAPPGSADPGVGDACRKLATKAWSAVIPAEKKLPPEWEAALVARGQPKVYEGDALMKIGMPVGGVCAGLVYLGGDGKLWYWDIFNRYLSGVQPRQIQYKERSWHGLPQGLGAWQGGNYIDPVTTQPCPFQQGFALKIVAGGTTRVRTMDRQGWQHISFTGTYPVGTVRYADPDCPVRVTLEAYSPYCPLDFDNSSYPAVIMRYSLENTGAEEVRVEVGGWLENAVLLATGKDCPGVLRHNRVSAKPGLTLLACSAIIPAEDAKVRPDIVFEDFEKATFEGWVVEGTAFGTGPVAKQDLPAYMGDIGMRGGRVANSHAGAPIDEAAERNDADDAVRRDQATGRLISREFRIERKLIAFLIGGGNYPGRCCLNLVVDGKVVRSATGHNGHLMRADLFDVGEFAGRTAHLEVVDDMTGVAGNIGVDHMVFTDVLSPTKNPDWGTMALAALGSAGGGGSARLREAAASTLFDAGSEAEATMPLGERLIGGVTQSLTLAPGTRGTAEFVIAWHFANLPAIARGSETGSHYGRRFEHAAAVAEHLAANRVPLSEMTLRWRDTWYDSTLPYWFLDRTFISLDCLASTTCFRFGDGRFYTFEGVRSCLGHPNHVWHYAQGHARIFPELEQDVLERVWYGFAFHADGSMAYRGEHGGESAIDGHCGAILAVLRAHQTNPDGAMLARLWPRVRKSIEYANTRDRDHDGLLDLPMLTTLDEPWHGQIPWLSSLYLAALKAGEQLATEMGDAEFARDCRHRAATGRAAMDAKLFNGEWFVQLPDPANPEKLGAYETCHIDQVLGQSWAWQVGLGRVLNEATTRSALHAIWKYNFARNLDAYDRQADPKGRPYHADGEGGLVMTANALGRKVPFGIYSPFACYLSETMNGFEYQAAAHMIAEGMVKEGLAVIRTIDERYDGTKRNPFNEVECGDHYARSMASYGALIAISGFEYHGPKGHLGFAPQLTPEHFKAPFTAAEGWGSYEQRIQKSADRGQGAADSRRQTELTSRITLKYGNLRVKTISLALAKEMKPNSATVAVDGRALDCRLSVKDGRAVISLAADVVIQVGEALVAMVG
ncbi:MAG: GH116 family glycosyl-hydrolase [Verrucomicrobia bacterium]|nr:GH116 family glycosyl-hydrolase [Verrucomicrobiota bacterium]